MTSNIRILRDFRNYFIELKKSNSASYFELAILEEFFPNIRDPNGYFGNLESSKNDLKLLHLMSELNRKLSIPSEKTKIEKLHFDLFHTIIRTNSS
ncbi:MAG: hypothetical protein QXW79_00165 [Thermoplasmata archaeon]